MVAHRITAEEAALDARSDALRPHKTRRRCDDGPGGRVRNLARRCRHERFPGAAPSATGVGDMGYGGLISPAVVDFGLEWSLPAADGIENDDPPSLYPAPTALDAAAISPRSAFSAAT